MYVSNSERIKTTKATNIEKEEINMNPSQEELQEQLTNEEVIDGELSEEELHIIAAGLFGDLFALNLPKASFESTASVS